MKRLIVAFSTVLLSSCSRYPPMDTVEYVDLQRFTGDWYVIANIPTFIEINAHNAVENYSLNDDGTIDTVFTFRNGKFEGEQKRYNPTGFVKNKETNALWGMQFIWPIKADYRVVYLDDAYQVTIIGREARDHVWLMAREPAITADKYQWLLGFIARLGYDISKVQRVPQEWD